MAGFLDPLIIEVRRVEDIRAHRLVNPLRYQSRSGRVYCVEAGFLSDLASVPRWSAILFERVEGETASAAVLHDWFYVTHCVDRAEADRIFHEALRLSGVSRAMAWIMWAGVRLGGGRGWIKDFEPLGGKMKLTKTLFEKFLPRPTSKWGSGWSRKAAIWDGYVEAMTSDEADVLFEEFGISNRQRMAHLLATWAHETGRFTILWESGAYSATRITQVFGVGRHSARVTPSEARALAYNGPALFDRVYGIGNPKKAKELGNLEKGDGWKFRGLGPNQLTGRWAHERYAGKVGCDVDDLADPVLNCLHGSLLEWKEKDCNRYADRDDVVSIRKLINAGSTSVPTSRINGLDDVRSHLARAKKWLGTDVANRNDGTLREGDSGPDVRTMQERLKEAGHHLGDIDGEFGSITRDAVSAFQVKRGLDATGEFDEATKEALDTSLSDTSVVVREGPPPRPVDAKELRNRGSRTIRLWDAIKWLGRFFYGIPAGAAGLSFMGADSSGLGLDVIEGMVSAAEQAQGVVNRIGGVMGIEIPGYAIALVGVFVLGISVAKIATWGTNVRVEDAQSGAHLGK